MKVQLHGWIQVTPGNSRYCYATECMSVDRFWRVHGYSISDIRELINFSLVLHLSNNKFNNITSWIISVPETNSVKQIFLRFIIIYVEFGDNIEK